MRGGWTKRPESNQICFVSRGGLQENYFVNKLVTRRIERPRKSESVLFGLLNRSFWYGERILESTDRKRSLSRLPKRAKMGKMVARGGQMEGEGTGKERQAKAKTGKARDSVKGGVYRKRIKHSKASARPGIRLLRGLQPTNGGPRGEVTSVARSPNFRGCKSRMGSLATTSRLLDSVLLRAN